MQKLSIAIAHKKVVNPHSALKGKDCNNLLIVMSTIVNTKDIVQNYA